MFPAVNLTVLLATVLAILSASDRSEAKLRPAPADHVTIPVRRVHNVPNSGLHPSIVAAQHVNRAYKRLAKFKGRAEPPTHELLSNIHKSITALPAPLQKRYNHDGIADMINSLFDPLADKKITSADKNVATGHSGNNSSSNTNSATGNSTTSGGNSTSGGFSSVDAAAAAKNNLSKAKATTFAHSIGLDIESNDIAYVGEVQIGTPPRNFRMLMDSGSGDFWVGSESCHNDEGKVCGKHTVLGPKSSSSFKSLNKTWSITYGSGDVAGDLVQDNIAFGDLKLTAHKFGVARNESDDFSAGDVPIDGLIGLAKSQLSNQGVDTIIDSLHKLGQIQNAIVSYKISRLSDGLDDGEITIGAMDPAKYVASSVVTVKNVNTQGYWEGAVDAFKMNGKDLNMTNRTAILDTGTTLLVGPRDDVKTIHNAIPGSKSKDGTDWTIPCTTTAKLPLTFGGKDFSIDPRDLSFLPVDPKNLKGDCTSAISGSGSIGGDQEWLVGDVFLKNVYFSTDAGKDQISLANLS